MGQIMANLREAFERALPPLFAACSHLWADVACLAYEHAGSPYGPSTEAANVLRWLRDEGEKARSAAEREYQRERQDMILDLSAQVAAKKQIEGRAS